MLYYNSWGWDDMGNSEWINKRGARQLEAARAVEQHHGRIMGILAECLDDLAPELEGIGQFQQDLVLAGEVAYRLDKMINLGDPIAEVLDGVVIWFAALAAIGAWRAIERQHRLRGKRLATLQAALASDGERWTTAHRNRVERRISRLRRKLERGTEQPPRNG